MEDDFKKDKFNVISVNEFKDKRSRYGRFFSFEICDVCNKQGVKFEVIKYTGLFDLSLIRQAIPYRYLEKLTPYFTLSSSFSRGLPRFLYTIFYTCSEDCNSMLVLQQVGC